jgi:hypothetical protein
MPAKCTGDAGAAPRAGVLVIASILCGGCASAGGETSLAHPITSDMHRQCAGQMYSARTSQGRSAVNWHLYDYCMKRNAGAT